MKIRTLFLTPLLAAALPMALLWGGCGGGSAASGTISAANGGTVEVTDSKSSIYRSEAVFPAGAVSEDTKVSIEEADSFVTTPYLPQGPAVKFKPADLEINKSVEITIPYNFSGAPEGLTESDIIIFRNEDAYLHYSGGDLTIDKDKNTITFQANYLGTYQAGVVIPSSLSVGEAADIPINEDGTHGYTLLSSAGGGEEYVIALTSLPSIVFQQDPNVSSSSFTISTSEGSSSLTKLSAKQKPDSEVLKILARHYAKRDVIRGIERDLIRKSKAEDLEGAKLTLSGPLFKASDCEETVGSTCTVNMLDLDDWDNDGTSNDYIQVHSKVMYVGTYCIVVMDNDSSIYSSDEDDAAKANASSVASDIATVFDNMIYPRDTAIYGSPSDVDGNGKIIIFITSMLGPTGILGFYTLVDTLTNTGTGIPAASNEADLINAVYPGTYGTTNLSEELVLATLAHEFQHLINFNNNVLTQIVSGSGHTADISDISDSMLEEDYLNEGYSHFAEDIIGFADLASGPPEIVKNYFLSSPASASLVNNASSVPLATRALAYLFVRYLFEQAGGATISGSSYTDDGGPSALQAIVKSSYSGLKAVRDAFPSYDKQERTNFKEMFTDFILTLWNDGYDAASPGSSESKWNFEPIVKDTRSDSTASIVGNSWFGIDLTDTVNRRQLDTGTLIQLNGVNVVDFSYGAESLTGSIYTAAAYYARFGRTGTGTLKITITSTDTPALLGKVFRIK